MTQRTMTACLLLVLLLVWPNVLGCWNMMGSGLRLGESVSLDDNRISISISEDIDGSEAGVVAVITDSRERLADLDQVQSLLVNGQELTGPDSGGAYRATIPTSSAYTLTVNDPTRGVQDTTIIPPSAFTITSPGGGDSASLSGFTVEWSEADSNLEVQVSLSQAIFDELRLVEFEPESDSGRRTIETSELSIFQQGADLTIEVTKVEHRDRVNGFSFGELTSRVSVTSRVTPGP